MRFNILNFPPERSIVINDNVRKHLCVSDVSLDTIGRAACLPPFHALSCLPIVFITLCHRFGFIHSSLFIVLVIVRSVAVFSIFIGMKIKPLKRYQRCIQAKRCRIQNQCLVVPVDLKPYGMFFKRLQNVCLPDSRLFSSIRG